jgi:hypothetical protein
MATGSMPNTGLSPAWSLNSGSCNLVPDDERHHHHPYRIGPSTGEVVGIVLAWILILFLLANNIEQTKTVNAKLDKIEVSTRKRMRLAYAIAFKLGMSAKEVHDAILEPVDGEYDGN